MSLSLLRRRSERPPQDALKSRDPQAWEELVVEQHPRVFNLLLRLTGDREEAADLTQETFLAAYKSAHTFAGKSRPETWLYGVALNCCRSWRRRNVGREPPIELPDDLPDPEPTAEQLAQLRERSDVVCEAVQRLPEIYRRIVALRYFAGVSSAEIAASEGLDAGTVRWRLHQAIGKLWVMLQPHIGKEEEQ